MKFLTRAKAIWYERPSSTWALLMVLASLTRLLLRLRRIFKMPNATVSNNNTDRFELKTLEGAFVVIRRMTFGEKLARQDEIFSMHASMESKQLEMNMLNKKAALKDFGNLVIDHNLTDENDRKLNFANPQDVLMLDPRVGDEISGYIDQLNSFED